MNGLRSGAVIIGYIRPPWVLAHECEMRPIMFLFSPLTSVMLDANTTE